MGRPFTISCHPFPQSISETEASRYLLLSLPGQDPMTVRQLAWCTQEPRTERQIHSALLPPTRCPQTGPFWSPEPTVHPFQAGLRHRVPPHCLPLKTPPLSVCGRAPPPLSALLLKCHFYPHHAHLPATITQICFISIMRFNYHPSYLFSTCWLYNLSSFSSVGLPTTSPAYVDPKRLWAP